MITEKNKIENEAVYSDDKSHRYLLSRIWDSYYALRTINRIQIKCCVLRLPDVINETFEPDEPRPVDKNEILDEDLNFYI